MAGHERLPWFEDRGPNPYLVVTSIVKQAGSEGEQSTPWARGQFVSWFASNQLPVLFEPLVKFFSPIAYFFDKDAGGWNRIYLFAVILWTLLVWGFFGGAITRMAAVQVARNEKISMVEALKFARTRLQSFFSAPVFPLLFLGGLTLFLIIFGLFSGLIPILGDVVISGLLWPIVLILGLIMAVVLIGLLGWPLMNATISAEGSDSFDALSRSYSYVYQAPWHYLWYTTVAMAYGAVLVFFVGLMGSLMVYLGQWAWVSQAPISWQVPDPCQRPRTNVSCSFCQCAPDLLSAWRDLLTLHGSKHVNVKTEPFEMSKEYTESMKPWNYIGTFFVSIWLYLLFLLIVGFGYSYFWTASTVIYLLMRHKVDDTDLDEIHLEEEETEEPFAKDMSSPTTIVPPAPKPVSADKGNCWSPWWKPRLARDAGQFRRQRLRSKLPPRMTNPMATAHRPPARNVAITPGHRRPHAPRDYFIAPSVMPTKMEMRYVAAGYPFQRPMDRFALGRAGPKSQ